VRVRGGLLAGAVLTAGLAWALAGTGPAAAAVPAGGSPRACAAYAYAAIEEHVMVTATPPACAGLTRAQVNQAVASAIDATLGQGSKADRRRRAGAASAWVRALITAPPPVRASLSAGGTGGARGGTGGTAPAGGASGALRLGGVSEGAAQAGALLAWLATAASGGLVLARWLRAGGRLRRTSATATPPAVIAGHVGGGLLGLVLWVAFLLGGGTVLAWIALGLLAPVAGAGMAVLALGLPSPVPAAGAVRRRSGMPVLTIFAHGVFAATAILLVLIATIGA
jgi:hypothetical protein